MAAESSSAAVSNSLQPSVPASATSCAIRSFAPGCDGGSPSSLITVASTTSSPCASRAASSSSTLGTSGSLRENGLQDRCRGRDVFVGGAVTGGQAQAAQRLLQ